MALAFFGGISLAKPMPLLQLPNPKFYPPRFVNLRCFSAGTRGPPDITKGHGDKINNLSSTFGNIESVEFTSSRVEKVKKFEKEEDTEEGEAETSSFDTTTLKEEVQTLTFSSGAGDVATEEEK